MSLSVTLADHRASGNAQTGSPCVRFEKCFAFDLVHVEGRDPNDTACVLHRSSEPFKGLDYFSEVVKSSLLC